MDVMSKIFSCVINVRCFRILDARGTKFQFGGTPKIGCSDGLFTIKTILNMGKNHNLPTFVAFFDLFKAFDTYGHELLIKVLERCGAPPKFFSAIHRMYQNLIVVLKVGNGIEEFFQEVGERQGDNTATVLLPFLMAAFTESLEDIWEDNAPKKENFNECPTMILRRGEEL